MLFSLFYIWLSSSKYLVMQTSSQPKLRPFVTTNSLVQITLDAEVHSSSYQLGALAFFKGHKYDAPERQPLPECQCVVDEHHWIFCNLSITIDLWPWVERRQLCSWLLRLCFSIIVPGKEEVVWMGNSEVLSGQVQLPTSATVDIVKAPCICEGFPGFHHCLEQHCGHSKSQAHHVCPNETNLKWMGRAVTINIFRRKIRKYHIGLPLSETTGKMWSYFTFGSPGEVSSSSLS